MKILFIARHFTYFRNYDSALRELARRGHRIHLAVEKSEALGGQRAVETLARECPQITFGEAPDRTEDRWSDLARRIRLGLDYLRYLDPFYDDAPLRRVRARERTPRALIALANPAVVRRAWGRRLVGWWLHALDLAVPPSATLVDYVRSQQPDVLLITPLVDLGSQQIDYVRAARRLHIPTGLAVWSWDHLASKAYIRECPERVLVWNETQRREAVEVHHVPPERVIVTGAQCFDHWFERQPSRTREVFCRQLGLRPDTPVVLYVCSGLVKGSPLEPPFVREWLTRLRASGDPRVATAGVLVRPHPTQMARWDGIDFGDLGPIALWGGNPIDEQSRADYFDSLYHSAAVVGLNTSAFIEAGIVGREVLAILPPEFHDSQDGTVHFKYLLQIGGGLLRVSRDFDAHVEQLSEALRRTEPREHRHKAFLESFVRPRGLAVPATPAFVDAVESLSACRIAHRDAVRAPAAWRRALLTRIVQYAARPEAEKWVLSPRELAGLARTRAEAARKADVILARTRAEAARRADIRSAHERLRDERRRQQQANRARHRLERAAQVAEKRLPEPTRQPVNWWRARLGRLVRPIRQLLNVR